MDDDEFELTGNIFSSFRVGEKPQFQLEAKIRGYLTRLQGEGVIPEACLYDRRHSGLTEEGIDYTTHPPKYLVRCNCGYTARLDDINYGFSFQYKIDE